MDTDSTNKDPNSLSNPIENELDQGRKSFGIPNRQLSETSSPLTQDNSFSVSSLIQDRQNSNMTPPVLIARASNSNGLPLHMLESTGSNFSETRKDSGVNEEEAKMRKVSTTPFIKTVMADAEVVDATGFSMYNWIELQAILKSNYFVVKNEAESKRKIEKKINEMISKYNQLFTKIRENNERIRKTLDKEPIVEDEVIKVMNPNHEDLLGDADIFVKKLLYLIHDRPRVLATLVKGSPELSSLKAFEETLCTTFYEDIIADDVCDDDLIRLLAELLELDFEKANRFAELFYTEHFTNKMLASYLKRNECRRYVKSILKNPLLSIMKETAKIRLDPIEIERQLKRGGPRRPDTNTENRVRQRTSATMNDMVEKKKPAHHPNSTNPEENSSHYTTPKFRERRPRGETHAVNSSPPKEEEKAQDIMNTSTTRKPPGVALERIQNPDVVTALQTNFSLVKKYLSVLIQSIFDNVYSMPIGLRILCKILYILAKKRFPNGKEKEYNEVLGNFIFRKWISPNFISPEHNGIINDFQTNDEIIFNLAEIAKVLQAVFNQNTFDPNDIKSELNEYISELRPSVEEYYKELMAVNEDLVKQIRNGSRTSPDKIKSLSICISLQEIRLLAEGISKQKEKLVTISPEIVNLSEKILYYNRENNQFGDKVDPETKIKVKPTHCFTLFKELIYPEHLVTNYLEEFNKMQGFSKTLPDDQKFLLQVKHLLKNFLIHIEDIKNIVRLSKDGKITFDDVLEKYEDKLYANESKQIVSKEKPPTHISALFLISMMKELDPSYTSNNYYKLYQEIFQDFKNIASRLDFSISSIKLQLLRAYDALNRNYVSLKEVNEKKKKAIKKAMVRDFIKQTKIHLCITSPSTARTLGNSYKAPNSKKGSMLPGSDKPLPDKIELNIRDEKGCIHERFAIIRELAASGGMLGNISGRGYSQSISDRKPSMLGDSGEDIFNENNYHSNTIDEFIQIFGNIKEVKDVMETGEDKFGVKDAITKYYNQVRAEADKIFKGNSPDENDMIMDEIEEYICKRLYNKIYPVTETVADRRFWSLCKRLDWVNFSHLEIIQKNRRVAMWQYAAKVLNEIDNRITPLEKLDCMMECVKTIAQVLELAATKEGGGGADETLPIMIYVVLKACPKRIHSNLNFIGILRDSKKMESGEGFCYTQVLLSVASLEDANADFFKMTHEEFIQAIKEKEKEFNLPEIENVIL